MANLRETPSSCEASHRLREAHRIEPAVGGAARHLGARAQDGVDLGAGAVAGVRAEDAHAVAVKPHGGKIGAGEVRADLAALIEIAAHADPAERARRVGREASARVEHVAEPEALPAD